MERSRGSISIVVSIALAACVVIASAVMFVPSLHGIKDKIIGAASKAAPSATKPGSPTTNPTAPVKAKPTDVPAGPVLDASKVITRGDPSKPMIALTFDSNMTKGMQKRMPRGSDMYLNQAVLDELTATNTLATFFLASLWVQSYPDAAAAIAGNPNFDVASHSYLHRSYGPDPYHIGLLPPADYVTDMQKSEEVLKALKPVHMTNYFRFPGGVYTAESLRAAKAAGVQPIEYDVVSGDVKGTPMALDPAAIAQNVIDQVHSGAIIIMHITKDNAPQTAEALAEILPKLCSADSAFKCVRLSELLASGNVTYGAPSFTG